MNDERGTHQIVWLSLLGAILLYAAMPMLAAPVMESPPPGLALGAFALVVSTTGLVFALPRRMAAAPAGAEQDLGVRAFQRKVVQWALCETIALLGLVLYLLGGGTAWLWALCLWGAILIGMHGPRETLPGDARDLAHPDVRIG